MKHSILCAFLVLGASISMASAQTAGQDMKNAGHETKEAAKDVGKGTEHAAKTTGRKTKNVAKRATHATAKETEKGADKVEEKTR
jgi:predicted small secreted protein